MNPVVLPLAALLTAGFAIATAAEDKPPAPSGRFVLHCAAQMQTKRLAVDLPGKTVNGTRATVEPTAITWKTEIPGADAGNKKKPKRFVVHQLDRLDGTYRSWLEDGSNELAVVYGCDRAPAARF